MTFEIGAGVIYCLTLFWLVVCLWRGHRDRRINLWDCITITAKDGRTFTDPKKLAYVGAFAIMAIAFAYLAVTNRLTEWYCATFVTAFVAGKWLGDREQRLSQQQKPQAGA